MEAFRKSQFLLFGLVRSEPHITPASCQQLFFSCFYEIVKQNCFVAASCLLVNMMTRKTKVRKYSACAGCRLPTKVPASTFSCWKDFLNPNFSLGLRLTWRYSIIHRKSGREAIYFYEMTESCDYFNIPRETQLQ